MRRRTMLASVVLGALAAIVLPAPVGSAPWHRPVWTARYDGVGRDDVANAVVITPDGGTVIVAGWSQASAGATDFFTAALDATTGTQRWESWYHGVAGGANSALAIAIDPGGRRVFVTGESTGPDRNPDFATVAYSVRTGRQLWVAREGPDRGEAGARDIAVSPDGSLVFVTGQSWEYDFNFDFVTLAYDAESGDVRWRAQYAGPAEDDSPAAVGVSPDGDKVFVTGGSINPNTNLSWATLAYDAATGDELWVRRYAPGGLNSGANDLVVGPQGGRVFVTGYSVYPGDGNDVATLAYRASDGQRLWEHRYDNGDDSEDVGRAVALDPTGALVFVAASSGPVGTPVSYLTLALDSRTGARRWLAPLGQRNGAIDIPWDIAVDPSVGTVYVTGETWATGERDILTAAYDPISGSLLWVAGYGRPAAIDAPMALAVDPGGVYVSGLSERLGSLDALTIAYLP